MNKISKFLMILILSCLCCAANFAQKSLNLNFELKAYNYLLPKNWYTHGEDLNISLDSIDKHSGNYSLKINAHNNVCANGRFIGRLPNEVFAGKSIEYKGWIKTKGVENGYAGLLFNVEEADGKILVLNDIDRHCIYGDNNWTQLSLKMDISKGVKSIKFGGIFVGKGTAWFDNLELYINGNKYIDIIETEPKTFLSQKEIIELKKYIYPLKTSVSDGGYIEDFNIIKKLIGDSKIIGLGEVSHGSSEIYKIKNRIVQYLMVNNGFNIFSIEANMPEAYKLNDYIVRGKGNPKKLISNMKFWIWNTKEMLDLVEWMHNFNQSSQSIEYTGFDMQLYDGSIRELSDNFKNNIEVEKKIFNLKKKLDRISIQKQSEMKNVTDIEMKDIDSILLFLKQSIEKSTFQISKKIWLQRNIKIIQQYLGFNYSNYIWRDKCMAENFTWIKECNPDSRFIIWAHNIHIMKTDEVMGYYLAQKFGNDYKTFGFTFFDGSFNAFGNKGVTSYDSVKAYPGTLEYLLNQLNEPAFILDLNKIKSDKNRYTEWLNYRLDYRIAGAINDSSNEFMNRNIVEDFDYLIFIKKSSPSILLPYLQ